MCSYNLSNLAQTFFATVIERIYWAHIPNYYTYTDTGRVRQRQDRSKIQTWNNWLNSRASYSNLINISVVAISIILALVLALVFPILNTYDILSPIYTLETSFGIFFSLVSGLLFFCFFNSNFISKNQLEVSDVSVEFGNVMVCSILGIATCVKYYF